ncbi:sugar ABC transporter permease [Paenibacillus sp. J31TS4]|uniref:carbohydrate ABC transporter permease n=1 Tax=Paenibacillus sp. J31TS4 TaxID=2807195 RepID=UPI001B136C0F|nr:carbohydrate ABC transporter permease [Paenibacillus sp. J31TS4]GIP39476.1 sugar ABC transporter permease [Paenibacillus sp. J31TS4]
MQKKAVLAAGFQQTKAAGRRRFKPAVWHQTILYLVLGLFVFLTVAPILFTLFSSFKNNAQILGGFWSLPKPLQLENYAIAFSAVWRYTANTVVYSVVGSVLVVLLSAVSGYTFAKKDFLGKEVLFLMMLAIMMIPGVLTLIPSYVLYSDLGLINTPWVIIISAAAGGQIFGTFLCRSFMGGLSNELFDSAKIDGASEYTVFVKIVIPLTVPVLMTLFIMSSVGIYNDYIWPLLTIKSNEIQMIGVGLTQFKNQFGISDMGVEFAAYMISSIPLVVLFSFGMKYYIQGLTQGALKI